MSPALKQMTRGKAPGPDDVMTDTIIEGGAILTKKLPKLYTACVNKGKIPEQWKKANTIIYKKGNMRSKNLQN